MQGISPSKEEKIINIGDMATGVDTTFSMVGGRFCVITLISDSLAASNTISLCCGGQHSQYLPQTPNKTVTITAGSGDTCASATVDLAGFQTVRVQAISGTTAGKIILEPMWC